MDHFSLTQNDPTCNARLGILRTSHGSVETPVFMPVGTAASVKAMPQDFLRELQVRILLGNTYHLYLRPGHEIIGTLGGLHRFMSWDRAILTDSGGFQVFSHQKLRRITEEGVQFRSHLDGSSHWLTPEKAVEIQQALGSDIAMALDDCTPYPCTPEMTRTSLLRTSRWARRCRQAFVPGMQRQYGIIQGGMHKELRQESLNRTVEIGFDGYALGGFSVGEPKQLMWELVAEFAPRLPQHQPRYLMGVGTPLDIINGVTSGIDMFDCVLPTRNARNGCLFTSQGRIVIKNSRYLRDEGPLDPNCGCKVCKSYSRAYLRHLFMSGEMLSAVLNTYHNLYYYLDIMAKIRQFIQLKNLAGLREQLIQVYEE